jgi:hypothetical protein
LRDGSGGVGYSLGGDAHFLSDRLKLGERESLLRRWLFVPRGGRVGRRFEDCGDLVVVKATLG